MKVVALTGAGISKQSGIFTFQEKEDIREKLHRDYALNHPEEYNALIKEIKDICKKAEPNDAHIALADFKVKVITMNIDGLHNKVQNDVLELHGNLPKDNEMDIAYKLSNKPVLYGDLAPNYDKAIKIVSELSKEDYFLVIGCSFYTSIAVFLREIASSNGVKVIEIQSDAKNNVRKILHSIYNLNK